MTDQLDLTPIRQRLEAATPDGWARWRDMDDVPEMHGFFMVGIAAEVIPDGEVMVETVEPDGPSPVAHCYTEPDAEFIANTPTDIAALLAEVERLRAKVERVRTIHYPADNDTKRTPVCEECHGSEGIHPCGCWAPRDRQPVCGHCNEGTKGQSVDYPCPTIRALDGGGSDD